MLCFSGLPVVLPDQKEAVLIGAAVLGACASQDYSSIQVEWHTHSLLTKSITSVMACLGKKKGWRLFLG